MAEVIHDPELEWLKHVPPVGLVVAPSLLKGLGLTPLRQTQADTAEVEELLEKETDRPALRDPWAFASRILGWEGKHVAGSPTGPELPEDLLVRLPEHGTTLTPTWAVAELGDGPRRWQLLVRIEAAGIDPDARGALDGWEATPHQRFERLLRETGVFAGLLVTDNAIRLVYAPRGETSGYLSFPLRPLATVAGRQMLAGLKLLLGAFRLFADADDRRLPALLQKSREAQAAVSTALAEQVLGALHELLRGLDAAEPALIRSLARTHPGHVYEGLLAVLMRLVFILYAEDRDLLPSLSTPRARTLYEAGYSARGLYAKLVEDASLHPDTMDERRGGWGRLLALFRLIYGGHASGFIQARGGKLFDPDEYPFLEGRSAKDDLPRVLTVSDGCILRILEGLMTLKLRGAERERLSYRTLDVEQIGSVYETVMGFTVEAAPARMLAIKAGKNNRTPIFLDLDALTATKGAERIKAIKEAAGRQLSDAQAKPVKAAGTVDDLAAALDAIVDPRGSPRSAPAAAGTPILQPTDERRRTGSHYTPRSLTGPIVRHALEPAFARLGPDATPAQVLELKVCDPAMGSGAFLVEACRAIGERLVSAWTRWPETRPKIPADEDEELHARRLVAQRCLYGVDKNPRAVDLARLSLWLATLAKDHEFTFLDHALKAGDSLVGLTRAQMRAANWDEGKAGLPLLKGVIDERVEAALHGRAEIREAPDDVTRAIQEIRHRTVEQRLGHARLIGDAVIAAFFSADKPRARERQRQEVESWLSGGDAKAWQRLEALARTLRGEEPLTLPFRGPLPLPRAGEGIERDAPLPLPQAVEGDASGAGLPLPLAGEGRGEGTAIRPFHWEIEFPEVFARDNSGFDAIVGNPPFLSGSRTSQMFGTNYFQWLLENFIGAKHQCDLVAFFSRKAFSLLRTGGAAGFIATNTLAQGDTRESSLQWIVRHGGQIFRVLKRVVWPGEAAVVVSVIHFGKLAEDYIFYNNERVSRICAYLVPGSYDESPHPIAQNPFYSKGSQIYGQGFVFDDNDSKANSLQVLDKIRPDLNEMSYVRPMFGGIDLNQQPTLITKKWVINVSELETEEELRRLPKIYDIIVNKVKPERLNLPDNSNNKPLKKRWWAYQAPRPALYRRLLKRHYCIGHAEISPYVAFRLLPAGPIYIKTVILIDLESMSGFAVLQSRVHELWARFFSSSMKDDLRYTPSDCFRTFPFPAAFETDPALEAAGEAYHAHRAKLMIARNEGLTKTYNRFHASTEAAADIRRLRELHAAMDVAVLHAYGWDDLAARAAPEFIEQDADEGKTPKTRLDWPPAFKDDLLARLLALNAARAEAERRAGVTAPPEDDDEMEAELDNEVHSA